MRQAIFPEPSEAYLAQVAQDVIQATPEAVARRMADLVSEQDDWRARCLNMNPAESLLSHKARAVLASDMATRLSEGAPGAKLYPHGQQNRIIDEIEATVIALAARQYGADYVEWRPVSTSMALAAVFFALLKPGDVILSQDADGGGNYAYHHTGPLGLTDAKIVQAARKGDAFEIDADGLAEQARALKPRMIIVGGSNVLFPYPLRRMREIADSVGAWLVYDAAHLGLLVSSGDFQRPLAEGAHLMVTSTHKIMGGPVGGLVLTNDPTIAEKISEIVFPGFTQTRDQNKLAALAIALAETAAFGPKLARHMVINARALAEGLEEEGFSPLEGARGFTATHQIFVAIGERARSFELDAQAANILFTDCALTGEGALGRRTGLRLATHEISRIGLGSDDMRQIAAFLGRLWRNPDDAHAVRSEVEAMLARFKRITFSFDE